MATLTLNDVLKTYPNGYEAIKSVDLAVNHGEFVVIVGPSGCGKSTLLRMVAGLEEISGGKMYIDDTCVNAIPASGRDVAMVFQNYALYPHMSVFDNMAYGLKIRKMAKAEITTRVQNAAKILGLTEQLERRPKQLSGGQRQRVAMGRAIVRNPKLFLFDEPLSNLDAKLRVHMRLEMQSLHQRLKTTSLYVTHDQVEAMTLAERIVILNGGRVEQVGTPSEIYAKPASVFVAEFIGAPPMTVLPVSAYGTQLELAGMRLPWPAALPEGKCLLGVRPEHIELLAIGADASKGQVALPVQVITRELLGAETLMYLALGNTDTRLIARLPASQAAAHAETGSRWQAVFDPKLVTWFDEKTQLRLPSPIRRAA